MRTGAMVLALCAVLLLQACGRKGGNPPRPVTSGLMPMVQVA
ncbi:lipoprotein [Herbaspirillum sp.]